MKSRSMLLSLSAAAALAFLAVAYAVHTGFITRPMLVDVGYLRWSRGSAPFQQRFLAKFERDWRFREKFLGKPIESLRPLFPSLHSGSAYDPDSYRAKNVPTFFFHYEGNQFQDYWFDGAQQDFGFCALVVDGRVKDFFFVKG